MSYYRPDDTPDPLHEQLRALLGDRPFVLSVLETVEPIGDGQAESAVRTMVHRMEPLQVLVVLNAFSATMLGEVGRERYGDHLAEHFREQLDGVRGVLDDVLGDALPVDADEQRFVPLDDALGDALDHEVAQDAAAVADEDGDRG